MCSRSRVALDPLLCGAPFRAKVHLSPNRMPRAGVACAIPHDGECRQQEEDTQEERKRKKQNKRLRMARARHRHGGRSTVRTPLRRGSQALVSPLLSSAVGVPHGADLCLDHEERPRYSTTQLGSASSCLSLVMRSRLTPYTLRASCMVPRGSARRRQDQKRDRDVPRGSTGRDPRGRAPPGGPSARPDSLVSSTAPFPGRRKEGQENAPHPRSDP